MNQALYDFALYLLGMTEAQLTHKYRMGQYTAEAANMFGDDLIQWIDTGNNSLTACTNKGVTPDMVMAAAPDLEWRQTEVGGVPRLSATLNEACGNLLIVIWVQQDEKLF